MARYPILSSMVMGVTPGNAEHTYRERVVPYLTEVWLREYEARFPDANAVEVELDGFFYLFDLAHERLLAAWGVSRGRSGAQRPTSRMRGHPLSDGPLYHRGHAIAHSLGGGTDINLVPQLGRVNVGAFRVLERRAVAHPGALYFTYWSYPDGNGQRPGRVDQGLLVPGRPAQVETHPN